jgi:hypothetical protein
VASRIFDSMEYGILDITVDELSDHFQCFLKKDMNVIKILKEWYSA